MFHDPLNWPSGMLWKRHGVTYTYNQANAKAKEISLIFFTNPLTLMVRGGTMCPHFFQAANSPWKKGTWGPKFLNFKFKRKMVFHSVFEWSRRCGQIVHCAPGTQAIFKNPAQIGLKKLQVLVSEMRGLTLLKFSLFHFVPYAITNNDLKKKNEKNLKTSILYRSPSTQSLVLRGRDARGAPRWSCNKDSLKIF